MGTHWWSSAVFTLQTQSRFIQRKLCPFTCKMNHCIYPRTCWEKKSKIPLYARVLACAGVGAGEKRWRSASLYVWNLTYICLHRHRVRLFYATDAVIPSLHILSNPAFSLIFVFLLHCCCCFFFSLTPINPLNDCALTMNATLFSLYLC
jgi:hypothetical protein